jgi:hypothetical protein
MLFFLVYNPFLSDGCQTETGSITALIQAKIMVAGML